MLLFATSLTGQTADYKQLGIDAFAKANYPLAISMMQKALEAAPQDKEIYYYLGYYIHYNAYDSRPLKGYDLSYSDTVHYYLNKALELDPNYGDAKYFYTAECGANAFYSLQQKNYENVKKYYKKAFEIGGFPQWSIEYGTQLLSQVEENGILFTHGDFQLNICWYLQFCENIRRDISVIPMTMLNRPFFVKEVKNSTLIKPIKMGVSDDEIFNMRPYKWEETKIILPLPEEIIAQYKLDTSFVSWTVAPDLKGVKNYLSGERAFLLEIIESNKWERPIYWTLGMDNRYLGGLDSFGSYKGLVYQLMPFKTKGTEFEIDQNSLKLLIDKNNFKNYQSILKTNQPRVSGRLLDYYANATVVLAKKYRETNQAEKVNDLIDFYKSTFIIGLDPVAEAQYLRDIKN